MKKLLFTVFAVIMSAQLFTVWSEIVFDASQVKGPLCVIRDSVNNRTLTMSPSRSQYNVVISDGFADITLSQVFINPGIKIKSTVYVFPLPDNGSVNAMEMEYKNKIYKASIMERKKAQQIYDSVSALGLVAALLVQDRPNVFQQSLANIEPGDTAYVKIKITMPLKYSSGIYECAIPTMIGERFQSSGSSFVQSSGTLWNPPENREGQSIQINVLLQTGFAIRNIISPTHDIITGEYSDFKDELIRRCVVSDTVKPNTDNSKGIMLANVATFPNRDFVLRFSRDAAAQDFTIVSQYDYDYKKGFFAFTMFPDDTASNSTRPNLEIVLLIDISGSQGGWPLAKEKEIALNILGKLKSTDRVNVLAFSDNIYYAFSNNKAVDATEANIATAKTFIQSLQAMGGTQLLDGVKAALSTPLTSEAQRYYIFLTDGFITNETAILDEIRNHATRPTVFTFGAGGSLNRYFLETSAAVGNGYAVEVTQNEDAASMVNPAWEKISSPQIKNISVIFSNTTIGDLIIPKSTVLYAGDPFRIYGSYLTGGQTVVTVKGYRDGNPVEFTKTIELSSGNTSNFMIPKVWAKEKISRLSIDQGSTESRKDSIILISEQFQVLSNYTAFLAVDAQDITAGSSLSQKIESSFSIAVKDVLSIKVNPVFICKGKSIELTLPAGEYVTEFAIYDMAGRIIYKCSLTGTSHMSKFVWSGNLLSGNRLQKGRYIINIKTSSGRSIMRTVTWIGR